MNIEKHLILVKNEDKTERISYCKYDNGNWRVVYHNNSRAYNYNYVNVEWYKNPKIIDSEMSVVYDNNLPLSGIVRILDFGYYIRLVFKTGYNKVYRRSSIIIEETCLTNSDANNSFEYLKKIADKVSIKHEDDISFLSKHYNRITTISPRSVLSAYLEKKPLKKANKQIHSIFPFGFNISQKSATEKALTEQISVIEGPPGTGKT